MRRSKIERTMGMIAFLYVLIIFLFFLAGIILNIIAWATGGPYWLIHSKYADYGMACFVTSLGMIATGLLALLVAMAYTMLIYEEKK